MRQASDWPHHPAGKSHPLLPRRARPDPDGVPTNRWNDGKCSPEGRFWGGTMGEPGKVTDGAGALYVVDPDLSTRRAFGPVTISNGLAWGERRRGVGG